MATGSILSAERHIRNPRLNNGGRHILLDGVFFTGLATVSFLHQNLPV
jgi:hypothetical protein